jgi:hypothetical protein
MSLHTVQGAIDHWHALLRPDHELSAAFCGAFAERLREARLCFGSRVHCPFLRPLFVDEAQVALARSVSEAIARMGERVATAAGADPSVLDAVALSDAERRLAGIDPHHSRASTASRLDAFLLPESVWCAEYNAESPAGAGYTEALASQFEQLEVMARFRRRFQATAFPLIELLLQALVETYREWGGTASPPAVAIVDWRDVPTWAEFEILQTRFEQLGVPTIVSDPRDLTFDGRWLAASGRRIDLVYRRVLINDIVAHPDECAALVRACEANAVCMANAFRCKIAHKKAFFAVLTDDRFAPLFSEADRAVAAKHVPWTRVVREGRSDRRGVGIDLVPYVRGHRVELVLKPNDEYGGAGVTLGWETDEAGWDGTLQTALAAAPDSPWVVQERIEVRREPFPRFEPGAGASMASVLVDCAPYLFQGRFAGFLTRLSATGLANVTSGNGQVPAFMVKDRESRAQTEN